jgi:hypothetical protein
MNIVKIEEIIYNRTYMLGNYRTYTKACRAIDRGDYNTLFKIMKNLGLKYFTSSQIDEIIRLKDMQEAIRLSKRHDKQCLEYIRNPTNNKRLGINNTVKTMTKFTKRKK